MFLTLENIKVTFSKYCSIEGDILTCFISGHKYKINPGSPIPHLINSQGQKIWDIVSQILPSDYPLNDSWALTLDYYVLSKEPRYTIECYAPSISLDIKNITAINIIDDILLNKLPPDILLDYLCEISLPFRQIMYCSQLVSDTRNEIL